MKRKITALVMAVVLLIYAVYPADRVQAAEVAVPLGAAGLITLLMGAYGMTHDDVVGKAGAELEGACKYVYDRLYSLGENVYDLLNDDGTVKPDAVTSTGSLIVSDSLHQAMKKLTSELFDLAGNAANRVTLNLETEAYDPITLDFPYWMSVSKDYSDVQKYVAPTWTGSGSRMVSWYSSSFGTYRPISGGSMAVSAVVQRIPDDTASSYWFLAYGSDGLLRIYNCNQLGQNAVWYYVMGSRSFSGYILWRYLTGSGNPYWKWYSGTNNFDAWVGDYADIVYNANCTIWPSLAAFREALKAHDYTPPSTWSQTVSHTLRLDRSFQHAAKSWQKYDWANRAGERAIGIDAGLIGSDAASIIDGTYIDEWRSALDDVAGTITAENEAAYDAVSKALDGLAGQIDDLRADVLDGVASSADIATAADSIVDSISADVALTQEQIAELQQIAEESLKTATDTQEMVAQLSEAVAASGGMPTGENAAYTAPGLAEVFPFCIPFDLVHAFQSLAATAEAPVFDIPFKLDFEPLNIHINEDWSIDMSDYDVLIVIVRTFLTLDFCIALILITRKLIRG